jgi:HNH endonuclease
MKRCSKCLIEKSLDKFYGGSCSHCKPCHRASMKAIHEARRLTPAPKRIFRVARMTDLERFFKYVNKTDSCWMWTGGINYKGYGIFTVNGKTIGAHRFSYEAHHGPLPDGMMPDHLCRVRHCVRPDHLEAVTNLENTLRGENFIAVHAAKTHCVNGHLFDEANTRIDIRNGHQLRVCRPCQKIRVSQWEERHRAAR